MRAERARQTPAAAPAVHVIDPHAVYGVDDAIGIFRLRKSTVRREIREGRLRVSKRAGRYYLLGKWLIEWIEGGELRRRSDQNGSGRGLSGPRRSAAQASGRPG
jgi:hypothetical protein